MFSGLRGNVAAGMDEAAREWKRIFQEDERREASQKAEADRLALEQKKAEWTEEAERARAEQRTGERTQDRVWKLWDEQYNTSLEIDDPVAWQELYQSAVEAGSDRAPEMLANRQRGLLTSPQDAAKYVTSVLSGEVVPDLGLFETAINSQANHFQNSLGWSNDQRQDYIDSMMPIGQTMFEGGVEAVQAKHQAAILQNDKLSAEVTGLEASTEYTGMLTEQVAANISSLEKNDALEAERHVWEGERHQAAMAASEVSLQQMMQDLEQGAEMHPLLIEQLKENIGLMQVDKEGKEISVETQRATQQAVIDTAIAQAGLTGSEAIIAKAEAENVWTRLSLENAAAANSVSQAAALTQVHLQNIAESKRRMQSQDITDEAALQQLDDQRMSFVTGLVANGFSEVLAAKAPELLTDIVGEDNVDAVVAQLKEISDLKLDEITTEIEANTVVSYYRHEHAEELAELELRSAQARAALDEFKAETAPEEFAQNVKESNARINQLNASSSNLRAQAASRDTPGSPDGPAILTLDQVLDGTKKATGYSPKDVISLRGDYDNYLTKVGIYEGYLTLLENPQTRNTKAGDEALFALQAEYGEIDADTLIANLPDILEEEKATRRNEVVSAMGAMINHAASYLDPATETGYTLSPTVFGLNIAEGDPLWEEALLRNPAYLSNAIEGRQELTKATQEALPDVIARLATAGYRADPTNISSGVSASTVFDALKEEFGADVMAELGYRTPVDVQKDLQSHNALYQENLNRVIGILPQMGYDVYANNSRREAIGEIGTIVAEGSSILSQMRGNIDRPGTSAGVRGRAINFLESRGVPLNTFQKNMAGQGELINMVQRELAPLQRVYDSLTWLDPILATDFTGSLGR